MWDPQAGDGFLRQGDPVNCYPFIEAEKAAGATSPGRTPPRLLRGRTRTDPTSEVMGGTRTRREHRPATSRSEELDQRRAEALTLKQGGSRRCVGGGTARRRCPASGVLPRPDGESGRRLDDLCQGIGLRAWHEGVHDHCVTNDIDTLATALYVRADDLLKPYPDLAPWRPKIGLQPQLTDAELVTLAVMQALLGYTSEARW